MQGDDTKPRLIAGEALGELMRAMDLHKTGMRSAHEGYAVLLEEVDELWDEVKMNSRQRSIKKMREEAIQVAAMAMRFVHDVCDS
jgi:NTP pyrophosphatase (non-canonical NTP hydrolase)